MTTRVRADVLLLVAFCGFLFFYGLGAFGLLGADEPRYAQVAREMFDRHDWITPTLQGKPWMEKPALYYWQAMVAYSIKQFSGHKPIAGVVFNFVNEFEARKYGKHAFPYYYTNTYKKYYDR